jgi:putative MFS transporter
MAGPQAATSFADSPKLHELESALSKIGVTRAHKSIAFLILVGALFDSFEQNTIGVAATLLRAQWGLTNTDIGLLNTITSAPRRSGGSRPATSRTDTAAGSCSVST